MHIVEKNKDGTTTDIHFDKLDKPRRISCTFTRGKIRGAFTAILLGSADSTSLECTLDVEGLGLLKGKISRIPDKEGLKIPHIGWNSLDFHNNGRLFAGLEEHPYVYFVHSYYLHAEEPEIVKAVTDYSTTIHASVEKGNVFACQFHPEKSSRYGLKILENFAKLEKEGN